jgi:hypothetical protein
MDRRRRHFTRTDGAAHRERQKAAGIIRRRLEKKRHMANPRLYPVVGPSDGVTEKAVPHRQDELPKAAKNPRTPVLRRVISISVAALLAACGGSQTQIGSLGAVPQTSAIATHAERGGSSMVPEVKGQELLYVAEGHRAGIFSYPQGKRLGKTRGGYINNLQGECADTDGDIYVIDQYIASAYTYIYEYAHGGRVPIRHLADSSILDQSCSVDPLSGALAIVAISGGPVTIFQPDSASGRKYALPRHFGGYACSYDDRGNLFVNGANDHGDPRNILLLAELLNGGDAFAKITLPVIHPSKRGLGGVRWDGKFLAVGNGANIIYRLAVRGGTARVAGTVDLRQASYLPDIWIQGSTIVGGDGHVWNYPAGGKPAKTIHFKLSSGVAVSVPAS